jgi:hypothetical protein
MSISWPSFTGTDKLVGKSPSGKVSVHVDPSLGVPGMANATALLDDADRIITANDRIFRTPSQPVNVIIFAMSGATDGTGGADHMACDYVNGGNIEVCAAFGQPMRVSALFEAELSECSMSHNLCGQSTGEALSRWCASVVSGDALSDFASAPTWVADGMNDFINQTDPTDQNYDSIGCGMAFISWLISWDYGLDVIAPAMVKLGDSGTFAQLCTVLPGAKPDPWPRFMAALNALPGGVTDDNPFGRKVAVLKSHRLQK